MKRDMRKYILRKLVELIFTLLFVTLLSFLLMRLSSVDPATAYAKRMIGNPTAEQIEKIRIQLGFDKPLLVQYGRWVWDLLHFDLGVSLANGHDVWTDIATAFPKTLGIVALASIFQVVFIVIVSCIAFLLPWKLPKKAVRLLCILGVSIPSFYLATVYLDYFAVQKSLISVAGNTTLLSYISPAICIGVFGASFYAQTVELSWDGGRYTATLTDTNSVLSEYAFSSAQSDMTFAVDGNDLTISAETAPADGVTITAVRNNTRQGVVVWSDGHYGPDGTMQDVVTFRDTVSDPMYAYLHLKVGYGSVKIIKTSEDGKVSGISFTVSGNGTEQTVTTNADGEMQLDDLRPGVYTVTEQSNDRYEPQEVRQVTVISGQVATVAFHNMLKRGSLEVVKTAEDGLNEGVKFHLTGTSLAGLSVDEYAVTGSNGKAVFSNVLIGTDYILSEVDTGIRYVVPEDQTTAVEWNTVTQAEVRNVLKKWSATVTKWDAETGLPQGDAILAGAVYGVFKGEELVDTYITDESGQFTTTDYVCGDDWTIRELSPSEGYLLDDTVYPVGAKPQHYTAEHNPIALDVAEQVIRGSVALTKVDKDYPENKLEGAVFEVYRDSNRNQELDDEDELLGTMEELGGGEYALTGLCYGGYFAKETKAPEGFYLDENAYYFAITEDGETVTVENEAGKGFVNAAQVGSLRIVKTSSDGKLEGFSFRVTGANGYDRVFQTDAEGVILIEGLRIGDYAVSEVWDGISDGYLLPADKTASVYKGAVTEVEMHNEKKPTPEVPQTGDNSHAALWMGLLGLSGIGAVTVLLMRKRKK